MRIMVNHLNLSLIMYEKKSIFSNNLRIISQIFPPQRRKGHKELICGLRVAGCGLRRQLRRVDSTQAKIFFVRAFN